MIAPTSLVTHPDPSEYCARPWVVTEMRGVDSVKIQLLETVTDDGSHSLLAVAVPPVRHTDPISEFCSEVSLSDVQSGRSAESGVRAQTDREHGTRTLLKSSPAHDNKLLCVRFR